MIVPRQQKRKTIRGITHTEEAILFPGYIFFTAPVNMESTLELSNEYTLSILTTDRDDWRLYGADARIAQWLFTYNGILTFSKTYQEGDRIRIIEGPLKSVEGSIERIVKRDRSAQVALHFCNRIIKIWLGFEILEKV